MEDVLIIVMKLIRIFSRLDHLANSIGQKQGIKVIMRAMQRFPFCVQLQINCSACLANLASVEANRTIMLEDGCIRLVLDNMNKFMNAPAVQAEVCATLANLAGHETNARYIVQQGGCSLILKAMRRHIDQVDFQIQAFHAISSLGKIAKDIIDGENFMNTAMKCITLLFDQLDLVSAGWHSIGTLANSGISIVQHRTKIISMIFQSMKKFSLHHTFQITACFALAHVFFNNREAVIDENVVSDNQGIQNILETMTKFPNHESLQTTALFALGAIVMKSQTHRETLMNHHGIQTIMDAMARKYPKQKDDDGNLFNVGEPGAPEEEESPEPVLYSRVNTRVQCSKPLLLQLFGSVALLNLSETGYSYSCRKVPSVDYPIGWSASYFHGFEKGIRAN